MDQSPICPHVHFYFFVFSVMSYRRKASGICAECRSSHRRCFVRKSVLRSFAKFIGKHLCQSLSCNKVGGKKQLCLGKLCKRELQISDLVGILTRSWEFFRSATCLQPLEIRSWRYSVYIWCTYYLKGVSRDVY